MIIGLVLAVFFIDVFTIWSVRAKMIESAEQALDASLVAATFEVDATRGEIYIDPAIARTTGENFIQENMGLNTGLSNKFLTLTVVDFQVKRVADRPIIELVMSGKIKAMITNLFKMEGIEINIRKQMFHTGSYK
jgi:hypothetical protein